MPKKKPKPQAESSGPVLPADTNSPQTTQPDPLAPTVEKAELTAPIQPMTVEDRVSRVEMNVERIGNLVLGIVQAIDQSKQTPPAGNSPPNSQTSPFPSPAGGGFNIASIMPLVNTALQAFTAPAQAPQDPMMQQLGQGFMDMFRDSFKNFVSMVSQEQKIGHEVVSQIAAGKLKFMVEGGAEASATAT